MKDTEGKYGWMESPEGKYAWTVKIGERGQFVIPKEARDLFDIQPGDTILVLADAKRGIAIPPKASFMEMTQRMFNGTVPEASKEEK